MPNWKDYKGLVPWTFADQPNKFGYANNPRWKSTPEGESVPYPEEQVWSMDEPFQHSGGRHVPCGHWHKGEIVITPPIPCIEYRGEIRMSSYPINTGAETSNNALLYHSGYLYGGSLSTGYIFKLDQGSMSIVDFNTFDPADISGIYQLEYYDGYLYALITRSGYTGKWIQKISVANLSLVGLPMWAGSVCYGTDGHVYGAIGVGLTYSWVNSYKPITWAGWASYWNLLPDSYSYYIAALAEYINISDLNGAGIINFKINSKGFIFNPGPSSSISITVPYINQFDFTGKKIRGFRSNATIGPNEITQNPLNSDEIVTIRKTSTYGGLKIKYASTAGPNDQAIAIGTYLADNSITGLLDPLGAPDTTCFYHGRSIWHTNNRIYCMYGAYPPGNHTWIFSVNSSGVLIHQYVIPGSITKYSFVILGDYVYVWQDAIKPTDYTSSIIKLTLDLEFVCIKSCPGGLYAGLYTEVGRHIVTNETNLLYNYAGASMGTNLSLITKYEV